MNETGHCPNLGRKLAFHAQGMSPPRHYRFIECTLSNDASSQGLPFSFTSTANNSHYRSKIRCLGELPTCSACDKRSLACQYAVPRPESQPRDRRESTSPASSTLDRSMNADTPGWSASTIPASVEQNSGSLHDPSSNLATSIGSGQSWNTQSHAPGDSQPYRVGLTSANPTVETTDFRPSPSSNSDMMGLLHNDFNSNLDWLLDPQPDILPWLDHGDYSMGDCFSNIFGASFPTFESHLQRTGQSVPASPPSNASMQTSMPPISGLPTPNPREDCGPDDPWPMAWHASKIHRLRLPPLEAPVDFVHRPYFSPHTYIDTNILTEMQRLVNMCSVDIQDLELPAASKLNHCIDLYFVNFSQVPLQSPVRYQYSVILTMGLQVMALVHRPTFDPRASIVVTLAMVAIGVLYSDFTAAKKYSYSLSELIRKILVLMVRRPQGRAGCQS
jgi:hypothetical protein